MTPFSPKAFLRKVGPSRLERYFSAYGPALELDAQVPLFERHYRAFAALPPDLAQPHLVRLARVRHLTSDVARYALDQAARRAWGYDSPRTLASRELTTHELAMDLYLDAPALFELAEDLYQTDHLSRAHLFRGRRPLAAAVSCTHERRGLLRERLLPWIVQRAGGHQVVVEDRVVEDRVLLFVYFEDQVQPVDEIVEGERVETRPRRPVLKLALVYSQSEQRLRVHTPGLSRQLAEVARDAFAELYLGSRDFFVLDGRRGQFDFTRLVKGASELEPCEYPVRSATVTSLTFRASGEEGGVITVQPRGDLGDFLAAHLRAPVPAYAILAVKLRVMVVLNGRERPRTVALRLPNECHLRGDERDQAIERHLVLWGLERREAGSLREVVDVPRSDARLA